jgi:CRISPR-associated protein Csd2
MNMFDQDPAAARTGMHAQKLIVFKHVGIGEDEKEKKEQAKLGCAPAHQLFEMVKLIRKDTQQPARSFSDYELEFDPAKVPAGVTAEIKI